MREHHGQGSTREAKNAAAPEHIAEGNRFSVRHTEKPRSDAAAAGFDTQGAYNNEADTATGIAQCSKYTVATASNVKLQQLSRAHRADANGSTYVSCQRRDPLVPFRGSPDRGGLDHRRYLLQCIFCGAKPDHMVKDRADSQ